ncbi:MAG: hypothetical protein E7234_06035 [Lachnospiraceae bacterium]|nr:hypothetical protein [Lachnospiraceae bacterium]
MAKFKLNDILSKTSKDVHNSESEAKIISPHFKMISVNLLEPSEDNFYSMEQIQELKTAIELSGGVKQNLTVIPIDNAKYKVISGHRRRLASLSLVEEGKKEYEFLPCIIENIETDPEIQKLKEELLLITTNSQRVKTDWDKIEEVKRLKSVLERYKKTANIQGRIREIIAEYLQTSSSQIGRMEAIDNNLSSEFKEELKAQNIGSSVAYELSGLPVERQKELHNEFKDKKSIAIKEVKQKKKEIKPIENKEKTEVQQPLPGQIDIDGKIYENSHDDVFVGPKYLNLKELRARSGKAIWTVSVGKGGMWELIEFSKPNFEEKEVITLANLEDGLYDCFADTYGKTWIAFDHEIKDIDNFFEKEPKKYESK